MKTSQEIQLVEQKKQAFINAFTECFENPQIMEGIINQKGKKHMVLAGEITFTIVSAALGIAGALSAIPTLGATTPLAIAGIGGAVAGVTTMLGTRAFLYAMEQYDAHTGQQIEDRLRIMDTLHFVISETAHELARVFEYQISLLNDSDTKEMARSAALRIVKNYNKYTLYLLSVAEDVDLNTVFQKTSPLPASLPLLPVLVKQGEKIHLYGKKVDDRGNPMLDWTMDLDASKFKRLTFPAVKNIRSGQQPGLTTITQDKKYSEVYYEILLKKGHLTDVWTKEKLVEIVLKNRIKSGYSKTLSSARAQQQQWKTQDIFNVPSLRHACLSGNRRSIAFYCHTKTKSDVEKYGFRDSFRYAAAIRSPEADYNERKHHYVVVPNEALPRPKGAELPMYVLTPTKMMYYDEQGKKGAVAVEAANLSDIRNRLIQDNKVHVLSEEQLSRILSCCKPPSHAAYTPIFVHVSADMVIQYAQEQQREGTTKKSLNIWLSECYGNGHLIKAFCRADFSQCPNKNLSGCDFSDCDFSEAKFTGNINLTGTKFHNAYLVRTNFEGATLIDAEFGGADLRGANLKRANIKGANFSTYSDESGKHKTDLSWAQLEAPVHSDLYGTSPNDRTRSTLIDGAKIIGMTHEGIALESLTDRHVIQEAQEAMRTKIETLQQELDAFKGEMSGDQHNMQQKIDALQSILQAFKQESDVVMKQRILEGIEKHINEDLMPMITKALAACRTEREACSREREACSREREACRSEREACSRERSQIRQAFEKFCDKFTHNHASEVGTPLSLQSTVRSKSMPNVTSAYPGTLFRSSSPMVLPGSPTKPSIPTKQQRGQ